MGWEGAWGGDWAGAWGGYTPDEASPTALLLPSSIAWSDVGEDALTFEDA